MFFYIFNERKHRNFDRPNDRDATLELKRYKGDTKKNRIKVDRLFKSDVDISARVYHEEYEIKRLELPRNKLVPSAEIFHKGGIHQ